MDMDSPIDPRAVFEVIDSADVITFRFVTIPNRLLFDARHNEMEGPLLRLAWDRILRRIGSLGYPQIAGRAADVLREMEYRERAEVYSAITGAGYHHLWVRAC